ncbi:acetate--CoA ligase family protein [Limnohabitans sp. Rim11]|uniref:acetate--CoA ligase family protein n=1 Tax=Limnohabitans sp. Rim11 TaxID=1100719 RepID=UPI000A73BA98|nr:acetate--CoA ligase family protein [Limnohabitans sp. Rim11]
MHSLQPVFVPQSVAVVGASSDPDRIGGRLLRFLLEAQFEGTIYPINKSGALEIQGLPAYASVLDIPGNVDQAVIVVPAPGVETAVRESIAKGVKCVVVLTSGFAELGDAGRLAQNKLLQMCQQAGVRMLGPNSLGLLNVDTRYFATFSTVLYGLQPRSGNISLATQSGAFGSCAYGMATLRGLGLSKIIATGNEADIDVAECIDYLAEDPQTKVICAALESCRDGQRLRAALLKAAAAGKPVLVMKVGRTELGAAAASTHTGSLAGNDAVFDAVFLECGAYRPHSIEEMLDIAYYCTVTGRLPSNNALGIITGSGGIGVLMADHAGDLNLTMPALPPEGVAAAQALLPFAVAANPLDMTAQVTSLPNGVARTLEIMLAHGDYGTVFAYLAHAGLAPERFASTIDRLAELRLQYPHKDVVMVMLSATQSTEKLEAIGIPVFADPTRAMMAMGAAAKMAAQRKHLYAMPAKKPAASRLTDVSTEQGAKHVLKLAGLPVLSEQVCSTANAAAKFASEIGFPVVAKIASPDILHKTEIGGVLLNLQDAKAVESAFETLLARAHQHMPNAQIDGVLITPMVKGGVETILGVQVDPTFGPMILYGAGGTAVELFKDVALASAPLTPDSAKALIDKVKSSALLRGWRGAHAADENAVVNALCKLSEFAMTHADQLQSVDINPLLVQQQGAVCLDAVITLQSGH